MGNLKVEKMELKKVRVGKAMKEKDGKDMREKKVGKDMKMKKVGKDMRGKKVGKAMKVKRDGRKVVIKTKKVLKRKMERMEKHHLFQKRTSRKKQMKKKMRWIRRRMKGH